MDAVSLAKDIVGIVLALAAITLSVTITIVIAKLFPAIRQTVLNVEKVTRGAADVTPHLAEATVNMRNITANLLAVSKDISQTTPHAAEAMANVKDITANLLSASKDISQATPVLRLLGPAGATANIAQQGLGRIGGWLRSLIRR